MEEMLEKGYNLPLSQSAEEEAEADCKKAMERIRGIYAGSDKGNSLNPTPDGESISKMYEALRETGCPVTAAGFHYTMGNYEKMEQYATVCDRHDIHMERKRRSGDRRQLAQQDQRLGIHGERLVCL